MLLYTKSIIPNSIIFKLGFPNSILILPKNQKPFQIQRFPKPFSKILIRSFIYIDIYKILDKNLWITSYLHKFPFILQILSKTFLLAIDSTRGVYQIYITLFIQNQISNFDYSFQYHFHSNPYDVHISSVRYTNLIAHSITQFHFQTSIVHSIS